MWRFREALPPVGDPVSLGETRTSLIPFDLEGLTVLAKCDHTLPTGSYKDRGAALLMSYLHALGIEEAVEDSSGKRRGRPSRVRRPAPRCASKSSVRLRPRQAN